MTEKESKPINWTPVIATGAAVGGIALILYLINRGEAEDRELAKRILDDWELEWEEVQPYVEGMYAGGRTPTDAETNIISSMLEQMKFKEYTIYELSKSTWSELGALAGDIAAGWGIVIGSTVAGYAAIKLVKNWTNKHKPPPNYPCPACDFVGATKGALAYHIKTIHQISKANAAQAQQVFLQSNLWAQSTVAVESGLYDKVYLEWPKLSTTQILYIVLAIVVIVAAAILSAGAGAALAPAAAALVLA